MRSVLFIDIDTLLCVGLERAFNWNDRITFKKALGEGIPDFTYSWNMDPSMREGQSFSDLNSSAFRSLEYVQRTLADTHDLQTVALTRSSSSINDVCEMLSALRLGYDRPAIDLVLARIASVADAVAGHLEGEGADAD